MKKLACLVLALAAACGSSHSGSKTDGNTGGNGDGNGGGSDGSGGGGPGTVTVTLTNHPTNAAMFSFIAAYQDGSGPWQLAPAPNGDVYTLSINSPSWSFAWTCVPPQFGNARVELASFAIAEKKSLTETIPFGCTDVMPPATVALTGTVNNVGLNGGGVLLAYFGNPRNPAFVQLQGQTGTYTINTPPATHDIVIAHLLNNGGLGGNSNADAVAVARAVAVNGATTAPAIDFANASVSTATVTGLPTTATTHNATTRFFSAGGTQLALASDNAAPFESDALAAGDAASGDVYDQSITVTANGSTSVIESWTATIAAQTYTAPTAFGGATATVPTTTPYPEIQTTWSAYTGAVGYAWNATQGGGTGTGGGVQWHAVLGPGYVGGSPMYQMPNLSTLTGWSTSLQFMTGVAVAGVSTAWTSTGGTADFPVIDAVPAAAGTMRTAVDARWTVTP